MSKVLVFDPGESTGWMCAELEENSEGMMVIKELQGGTLPKNHTTVLDLMECTQPHVVVFETFNLYPGASKSLVWNSFYPCEVIGVIKCECMLQRYEMVGQAPGVKKFSGGLDTTWLEFEKHWKGLEDITEHTKDAYLHLKYYMHRQNAAAIRAKARGKK